MNSTTPKLCNMSEKQFAFPSNAIDKLIICIFCVYEIAHIYFI